MRSWFRRSISYLKIDLQITNDNLLYPHAKDIAGRITGRCFRHIRFAHSHARFSTICSLQLCSVQLKKQSFALSMVACSAIQHLQRHLFVFSCKDSTQCPPHVNRIANHQSRADNFTQELVIDDYASALSILGPSVPRSDRSKEPWN